VVAPPVKGAGELVEPPEVPPDVPDLLEADGAVPEGAGALDEGVEAVGYGAVMDVGYKVALSVETTMVAVVDAGAAVVAGIEAALDELEAWVVDAGAEAAQAQTAEAEAWTARPVTAPQPETTQLRAALAMAADWDALHWQAKSMAPQPTPLAAELMHDVYFRQLTALCRGTCPPLTAQEGTFAATAAH